MKEIVVAIVLNVLFASIAFGEDTNGLRIEALFLTKIKDMVLSNETVKSGSGKVPTNSG